MNNPRVTIAMTVRGNTPNLGECIDSILSQSIADFELLIVDEGLTEESHAVIECYNDPRIRIIKGSDNHIANLNKLLSESRGCYIAMTDSETIMHTDRLRIQADYLDAHPETDMLASDVDKPGEPEKSQKDTGIEINTKTFEPDLFAPDDFIDLCPIESSTVMMRRRSILKFSYNQDYIREADWRFFADMSIAGLKMRHIHQTLAHRTDDLRKTTSFTYGYETQQIRNNICKAILVREEECFNHATPIQETSSRMTAVIAFLNEGEEVANTVRSIRDTAGSKIDIIVVNDHSTDGYPYRESLSGLDVAYIENESRLGASLSKEKGVRLCRTPYFILLDAHMRFYSNDWHEILLSKLDENSNRLLCCGTRSLHKENGIVEESPRHTPTFGAHLILDPAGYIPDIKWSKPEKSKEHGLPGNKIPAILGAGYVSSKSYWTKIGGFRGLRHYGCEEAFISLKAWMEGGGCELVPEITIGHLYRNKTPYKLIYAQYVYNYLAILYLLFPSDLIRKGFAISEKRDPRSHAHALAFIMSNKDMLDGIRGEVEKIKRKGIMEIIGVNLRYCDFHKDKSYLKTVGNRIPEILEWLKETYPEIKSPGLYDGLAGFLLIYTYLRDCNDKEIDNIFQSTISTIFPLIDNKMLSYSMRNGIVGIGWALIYYISNSGSGLECSAMLDTIDRCLSEISPSRIRNLSLADGTAGILCYVAARLSFCRAQGLSHSFDSGFLEELKKQSADYEKQGKENHSILSWISSLNATPDQYADRCSIIRISDIASPPAFLPRNIARWAPSITGAAGTLISYLELYHEKKAYITLSADVTKALSFTTVPPTNLPRLTEDLPPCMKTIRQRRLQASILLFMNSWK